MVINDQGYFACSEFDNAVWTVAKNFKEAVTLLKENKFDFLTLDYNLGEKQNGYDIICWLEERAGNNFGFVPPDIQVHSANPIDQQKIQVVINRIMEILKNGS